MQSRKRRSAGMTLIEVMVVLVIMSVIAIGVGVNVMRSMETARESTTTARARTIQAVAVGFMLEHPDAACPTIAELDADDRFDSTTELTDGWGRDFELSCESRTVHVRSPGADGALQTEDDVVLERRARS